MIVETVIISKVFTQRIRLGVLCAAILATGPLQTTPAAAQQTARNADALLIVDCLLPGQIRRLGSRVTYVSRRRAVKATASECEIRGGEYVASDRASYATALKIWLPLAKAGKPDAETYVGEIFEKGLGVPPDFQAAANWYRSAANRGFSRAAINLGSLYERGRGVPKDPAQALYWYRKAAGLPNLQFGGAVPPVSSSIPDLVPPSTDQRNELDRLRREVEALNRRLADKEAELKHTQERFDRLQRKLEHSSSEADRQRAELQRMRDDLDQKRQQGQDASAAEVKSLERFIAKREERLAKKNWEVTRLLATLARMQIVTREQQAALDKLRRKSEQTPPTIQILEPELVPARGSQMARLPTSVSELLVVGRVASGTKVVALTVNGREEKISGKVFRTRVPVRNSEKKVRIVAIDRNGRKAVLQFLIPARRAYEASVDTGAGDLMAARLGYAMPSPAIKFGNYYALVIGNNNYRHVTKLDTAVYDAQEVARILKDMYGYNVKLLLNASRYEILSALNEQREKRTKDDNLLIYYAGHGELDKVNQRGNWLPIDAEPNSSANWISNVSITDVLNAMNVRQLLVVADSCYSGTLTRSALANISGGTTEDENIQLIRDMVRLRQRSRIALTAGGIQPVLDSAGGKHSVFAQAFIDVLKLNQGILTGQNLFQVIQARVAAAARGQRVNQVPEYAPIKFAGHEAGDYFLVRATN